MPDQAPSTAAQILRFGSYEADLRSGELRKEGMRLKLGGQPFQVLGILLQRAGDVVTREELQQALWPSDTFVDFDHSLNTAINKVRAALNDSGSNPRYVETLAKRGYRFIAPVQAVQPQSVSPAQASAPAATPLQQAAAEATHEDDLPRPPRNVVRGLFCLAQTMYLILYIVALWHFGGVEREAGRFASGFGFAVAVAVLVLAVIGIPVRFFLLFAAAFDYRSFAPKFNRMFPALLVLDVLWSLTPFLLADHIGVGLAFAATASLIYLPFGERTLIRMAWDVAR